MVEYPNGPVSGALAYLFLRKLCEELERENKLSPGVTRRMWADVLADLQGDTKVLSGDCREAIKHHRLTEQ